jgi:hypothetical protein
VLAWCIQVSQQRDAGEFFRLYLDALDEELLALLASISAHESPTAAQEHEVTQSNQSEVGKRGFTVRQLFRLDLGIADG